MSKSEPYILAFWQNFSCGVVSTAFYLLVRRLWWKKKSFRKRYYTFISSLFFWTLSDKNWPFLWKTFRFVGENCSVRDLKRVVENYNSSRNTISFFSVLSASEIEQKFLAFPRKNWPACQNCLFWFYVPRWTFFEKKKFFGKNLFFISSGHGARINGLPSFSLPLLCQSFILIVHTTILTFFFEILTTSFWLSDTSQI